MAESKNSILLLDDGSGREVECFYRTSTENIVDFVQAVNNLIHESQSNTSFSGTTMFENIHVTGTSELDGEVTCGNNLNVNSGIINLNGASITYGDSTTSVNISNYPCLNIGTKTWSFNTYKNGEQDSSLTVSSTDSSLNYNKNVNIGGNLKVSGNIESPVKLPNATITSDQNITTISTTSGGSIKLPNSNGAIQLTTKSGKIFKIEDDGTAYIDGKQLLTKTELMQLEHPVGSAYITFTDTNPSTILGIGTWEKVGTGYKLGIVGAVKDKNGTSHTTSAGANTDGEWSHANTVAELPAHNHTASVTKGAHTHSGSTNSTGNHYHGAMGENHDSSLYGMYDSGRNHAGTNGGVDWDNTIWKTSTNGAHSHTVSISSSGEHSHTATIGNTGTGNRHNNIEPAFGIYLWKRTA